MGRKFKPRKVIPKDKLIGFLEEGYTLEEIGKKYNKSRSYISELLDLHGIKAKDIPGRKKAMRKRREMLESRDFVTVMYDKISKQK